MIKNYFVMQFQEDDQIYYIKEYNGYLYYKGSGSPNLEEAVKITYAISDIKLLFNSYTEATKFKYDLLNRHRLLKLHQNDIEVVPIRKFVLEEEDLGRKIV